LFVEKKCQPFSIAQSAVRPRVVLWHNGTLQSAAEVPHEESKPARKPSMKNQFRLKKKKKKKAQSV